MEGALLQAVGLLYEAALEPSAWIAFLESFRALIDADGAHYLVWDPARNAPTFSVLTNYFDDDVNTRYATHYGAIDPRLGRLLDLPVDRWMLCHEQFDEAFVSASEFYNDSLIPIGVRYGAHMQTSPVDGLIGLLAFLRGPKARQYAEREANLLASIKPHVDRATRLFLRGSRLKLTAGLTQHALDALDYAVLIVDDAAMVHFHNRAAEDVISRSGTFKVCERKLRVATAAHASALQQLVRLATASAGARGGAFSVRASRRARDFQVMVLPLPSSHQEWGPEPRLALVVISNPDACLPFSPAALRELFGLTPAESRLACGLAEGKGLEELALEFDISITTARTNLKSIFAKTGVRRQAELVKVMLQAPRLKSAP